VIETDAVDRYDGPGGAALAEVLVGERSLYQRAREDPNL
jgi:hypothetical protein